MTSNKIRLFLTSLAFTLCAMLGSTFAASSTATSLVGATLQFSHVVSNDEGGTISGAVFVEVLKDTNVSINSGRGYIVNVTANRIMIKFTRQVSWADNNLFNGLVIDDIAWPNAPERVISDVKLTSKLASVTKERADLHKHTVLVDFRGLSTAQGDSIAIEVETNSAARP